MFLKNKAFLANPVDYILVYTWPLHTCSTGYTEVKYSQA